VNETEKMHTAAIRSNANELANLIDSLLTDYEVRWAFTRLFFSRKRREAHKQDAYEAMKRSDEQRQMLGILYK